MNCIVQRLALVLSFLLILAFPAITVSAQTKAVSGSVTDDTGEPLIGVSVTIKDSKQTGVITDIDGTFRIDVPSGRSVMLTFSYVGMKTLDVLYRGQRALNVIMEADVTMLDEAVAIGYATVKRRDLTGAVSSIRAADIEDVPVSDVTQALVGRLPGVQVSSASGAMDSEISVRVRGGVSVTQDNSPLYIIDGIPVEEGLNGLSTSDIESIDVLKDASAAAIYGSRGANGIIIVTTKSGRNARPKVSYEMFYGRKKLNKRIDVLDAADFVRLEFERSDGGYEQALSRYGEFSRIDENYPAGSGINWQERVLGESASTQMHRVSLTGGNKTSNFLVSFTHNDEEGIMVNSGARNNALRLKYSYRLNTQGKLDVFVNYSDKETRGSGSMENASSVLNTFITYRPTGGLHVSDEELENSAYDPLEADEDADWRNPLLTARTEERKRMDRILQMGGTFSYKIWKDLTFRTTVSYRRRHYETSFFADSDNPRAIKNSGAYGNVSHLFSDNVVNSNTLSYPWKISRQHSLTFLIGEEYIYQGSRSQGFGARRFPESNFGLDDMALASEATMPSSSRSSTRQLSFFGRVDYNFSGRYLFTAVVRADGSSKFSRDNRWGIFPSASFAWVASQEKFLRNVDEISLLKVRLSYGAVGNNRIGDYNTVARMHRIQTSVNNDATPGYVSTLANPDLKWETNITANLGIDLGLLDDRLNFTVDIYDTRTKDLLFDTQIPYTSGESSVMMNIGSTRSRGLEFALNSVNIRTRDFHWMTSFNMAFNNTVITRMANSDEIMIQSRWGNPQSAGDYMLKTGEPVGLMVGYVGDGIYGVGDFVYDMSGATTNDRWVLKDGIPYDDNLDPVPGMVKFKDLDGDGKITTEDRTIIGRAQPLFFGGFNNTFVYMGFDLSVFFNFTYGNDIYNATRMSASNMSLNNRNVVRSAFDGHFITVDENGRSLMDNPEKLADVNRNSWKPSVTGSGDMDFYDEYVEDGSFLRLNSITLGYTFPSRWMTKISVSNLRIYASAYNLWTLTGYSGYDPEVNVTPDASANGNLTPGLDWGAHPRALSIVAGLNLTF